MLTWPLNVAPLSRSYIEALWGNYQDALQPGSGVTWSRGRPIFFDAVEAGFVPMSADGLQLWETNMNAGKAGRAVNPGLEEWLAARNYGNPISEAQQYEMDNWAAYFAQLESAIAGSHGEHRSILEAQLQDYRRRQAEGASLADNYIANPANYAPNGAEQPMQTLVDPVIEMVGCTRCPAVGAGFGQPDSPFTGGNPPSGPAPHPVNVAELLIKPETVGAEPVRDLTSLPTGGASASLVTEPAASFNLSGTGVLILVLGAIGFWYLSTQ